MADVRATCDTPGCGRPIPKGGGGHPEICPKCLNDLREKDRAAVVDHPTHYNEHPSGIECITIAEHMGFNIGNAIKYLWRAGRKGASPTDDDLRKAIWYIERERQRLAKTRAT